MKKLLIQSVLVLILLSLLDPIPIRAQSTITVTQNEIVSDFPNKLTFQLSVRSSEKIQGIKLLYRTNGATCQSAIAQQEIEFTPGISVDAKWEWDFTLSGILPPGAEIYWQWQISDDRGNSLLTDEQTYLVNDPRHHWNLLTSGQVNLQWYEGSASFGQTLLGIAVQSLERMSTNAGVRTTGQIWLTIYPTTEELLEVDIHASEWAGGIAYPEYNSTIMAIGSQELEWAGSVIPHELAHLVTEAAVYNCLGMWLPTWLSEGLAVYAEGEISQYYNDLVSSALEKEKLPPLRTLESGFSSNSDEANLSYAESGIVVTYMIDQYGAEKMTGLLAAVQSGQMPDKAMQAVYGKDTNGIDAEWRISLGYAPQPTLIPTSSSAHTAVPTLALWTSAVRLTSTASPSPTQSPTPLLPTVTPIPPASPTLAPSAESQTDPEPSNSTGKPTWVILGIVLAAVILIAILVILLRRRRISP